MKKLAVIAISAITALSVGGGGVYAMGQIARSNAIGSDAAQNFAYVDAGILPDEAVLERVEFEFDRGRFVYDVEFTARGMEFDYTIDSATGEVITKSMDFSDDQIPSGTTPAAPQPMPRDSSQPQGPSVSSKDTIGIDKAKEVALSHAGIDSGEVIFDKAILERDDGRLFYDIEFYVLDSMEYEYEIDAVTGEVVEFSHEPWEVMGQGATSAPSGQSSAAPQGGNQQQSQAPQGGTSGNTGGSSTQQTQSKIGLEKAKSIALSDAGYSASSVTFTTAKEDYDDGTPVYDIEFVVPGKAEYDYEINAYTGAIRDKSVEQITSSRPAQSSTGSSSSSSNSGSTAQNSSPSTNNSTSGSASTQQTQSKIGLEKAKSIALSDAGYSASSVTFTTAKEDYDDGTPVYDIEFVVSGKAEYDYEINAYTGAIRDKSVEQIRQQSQSSSGSSGSGSSSSSSSSNSNSTAQNSSPSTNNSTSGSTSTQQTQSKIGLEKAKSIALSDAGYSASSVTFTTAKEDYDDGTPVYDIEFVVPGKAEYDYEINAYTGAIRDKSVEQIRQQSQSSSGSSGSGSGSSSSNSGSSSSTGSSSGSSSSQSSGSSQSASSTITVEDAKSIALKNAGLSASQVTFSKAMQDRDDGRLVYEIEFYVRGQAEYEYEIDASTGQILDKSVDEWDDD